MEIIILKNLLQASRSKHLKKNIFIVYCPRSVRIELATSMKIDTEMTIFLPKNSKGFVRSIFRGDKIMKFVVKNNVCG